VAQSSAMIDYSDPPLNFSESIDDVKLLLSGVLAVDEESRFGIMTLVTQVGHYDFLINQEVANNLVDQLEEFIRGESTKLIDIEE
jgi:hypothetical protein